MKHICLIVLLVISIGGVDRSALFAQPRKIPQTKSNHRPSFLKPCQIPNVSGEVLCGRYEVFENRETRRGRTISLNIQLLPAINSSPGPEPLFFLAGGPGGPATSLASFAADVFAKVRNERDIVLIDQRGTGNSNPLTCNVYGDTLRGHLEDLIPVQAVRNCRERWESQADLRLYTTPIAMDDLDEVRAALGYERINLFGTSYGTRAAQAYLRKYPGRVRAMILKGSTAISETFVQFMARDAQRALDIVLDDCVKDKVCYAAFPNIKTEFSAVVERFKKGPIEVDVTNTETGSVERVKLTGEAFGTTLRSLLQNPYSAAQVPMLIHQTFDNNYAPYIPFVKNLRANSPAGSGVFLTIINSEDLPLTNAEKVARESAGTFMGDYYYRQLVRACQDLPHRKMPKGYHSPVRSNVPVLFISGFRDPSTPPINAVNLARYLPNSLHVVFRYGGHSYGGFGSCTNNLMTEFISRGTTKGLNASCVSQLPQVPFKVPSVQTNMR